MREIAAVTSTSQYSSGLNVLRVIGKNDKADELIEFFIDSRRHNPDIFDVDNVFTFKINDKRFVERLRKVYLELKLEPTVEDILKLRRGANSYNSSEVEILARLETQETFDLFMSFKGEELTDYIRVFILLGGGKQELATKVNDVINKISSSSELNKCRMDKFRN